MQTFTCPACAKTLYFDNLSCLCGQQVAFDPDAQAMVNARTPCANRADIACNWVAEDPDDLCRSCTMTEVIPDLRAPDNLPLWAETERAKRQMLANLARWGWLTPRDPGARPVFRLLAETTDPAAPPVMMGHAEGIITINVTEADDAIRVARRESLGELYRTMLGHMRHEIAHFLHLRLLDDLTFVEGFRNLFGDERSDYGAALERHYATPATPSEQFITAYASAHPHEDWAETVAHLLHLVDIADSAATLGLRLGNGTAIGPDAYAETDAHAVLRRAISLSLAVTHVNRALDLPDLYPFVLSTQMREKLAFAHKALRNGPGQATRPA